MKAIATVLLVVLSFFSQSVMATEQMNMKLILDKNGIKIWSYRLPDSPYYGFKAVTTVKSTLTGVVALIMDTESASRWLYRTLEVQPISLENNKMNFVIRVVTDFPWPFKDREAVVEGKITQDPQNHFVRIESNSVNDYPIRDGYERMPKVEGGWLFRPLTNGSVEVTMTGHAELGGYVPAAIVNLLIQEHPYNTLLALKGVIGETRFQNARLTGIHEPVLN
ncbi:START domain-containing protein [Agitococcus lubricus]|uniref:START domain-containing protein n=1 Tax=Agitococcus lubricus TaxID=1077255 RepID=A0A2T5J004_9GAMM|nr:START domain-containing protein [Agitococcus lubricus]PTQ89683.1 START domain-containing protein [Agitococcus lubricus]